LFNLILSNIHILQDKHEQSHSIIIFNATLFKNKQPLLAIAAHSSNPMAENKDIETVIRRVTSVTNHLISSSTTTTSPPQLISLFHTSGSSRNNDSYQRVHGDVPSHDVVWKVASDDQGKDFTDIVYEKSVGEGIAKVSSLFSFSFYFFFNSKILDEFDYSSIILI
jgi:phospholipase/lecithinase/hemolysin